MNREVPLDYDVYDLDKDQKIKCIAISALVLFITAYLFYHSMLLSLCVSSLAYFSLPIYSKHLADRRRRKLQYDFKDALYSIAAALSSGRQMPEALHEASVSMALLHGEDALITRELRQASDKTLKMRQSVETVIIDIAFRSKIEDIINFADIYSTSVRTGGDIGKVLGRAAAMIMDKISVDREIAVLVQQKKQETKILMIMPIIVILFMQFFSADYIAVMYSSWPGRMIMSLALAAEALAFYMSQKITNVQV